jgi:hypothetical protein
MLLAIAIPVNGNSKKCAVIAYSVLYISSQYFEVFPESISVRWGAELAEPSLNIEVIRYQ